MHVNRNIYMNKKINMNMWTILQLYVECVREILTELDRARLWAERGTALSFSPTYLGILVWTSPPLIHNRKGWSAVLSSVYSQGKKGGCPPTFPTFPGWHPQWVLSPTFHAWPGRMHLVVSGRQDAHSPVIPAKASFSINPFPEGKTAAAPMNLWSHLPP